VRRGAVIVVVAVLAAVPAWAAATPVSFPHGTLDYQFTTIHESSPTGWSYKGDYHAANSASADPPYMRSMTFHNPEGFAFDSSVPERCSASDAQIALFGPSACPPGSKIAAGTARGKSFGQTTTLAVTVFNNTGEQILVAETPFITQISRGTIGPDQSVHYASPTCYPAAPGASCPFDNALQLGSDVKGPAYTRTVDGAVRSYMTTPPSCPVSGHWDTPIDFVWADGTEDTVVAQQAC
jgi:hypothetical protein